jgi:translocation and assembly module TamB
LTRLLAVLAALLTLLLVLAGPASAADADKGVIANLISRALSSPSMSVSIGAVEGVLSSDATISDIVLSDREGPWLKVDKVRLVWNRLALISRRLEVDRLTIGHMQVLRRPLPSDAPPPDAGTPQPILPELPLKVVVKDFAIQELSLGEPVAGVAARLDMAGRATLGPPSEGLDLSLTSHRLDAGGQLKALLTYVPQTDKLTVSIDSEEPAGGIFAHLANLPGLPPAKFTFAGEGPLDNFDAKLDFEAGADVWARGDVRVARQGDARRLTLDLNSRLEGMTPEVIRPVFAGETTLKGDVVFNADSSVVTPGLHLVSANARLDIEGQKTADDRLDVKIHAGAIPGSTQIGKLDLNATITGPAAAPSIEGDFDAGAIHGAQGSLDRVTATFHAHPSGDLTETATQILFDGQGIVKGLTLADPALAEAVGSDFTLTARGSAAAGGLMTFDTLDLVAPKFEAQYSGLLAPAKMQGKLHLTVGDLSRFSRLAGGKLAGEARIAADLDGAPSYGLVSATIEAHAQRLATPFALLDKAFGGELAITGVARMTPGGGFGFSNLIATGRNATARLDGDYRQGKTDVSATVEIPQAKAIDPRVDGKLDLVARLTGVSDDLGAEVKATLGAGRLLDRKTTGVTFAAVASHITGLPDARGSLTGDIDGQPLAGSAHIAKGADGGWALDDLGLSLASAHLTGALAIGADRLATGDVAFSAKNLDDLSPLVLMKLGGALQARITASADGGKQSATVVADSDRMSVGDNRLEGLKVDLTVADFWGARAIEGTAKLARAAIAGESIGDVRLNAKAGADFTDLDASGSVRGLAVKARGRLNGGTLARLDLASLTAEGRGRRIALARPATLVYGDDGLDIQNFALVLDSGRLTVAGRVGQRLDLKATATAIPLSIADIVAPGLGLSGVADGEATINGTMASPAGDWRLRLVRVSAPQLRGAGLPALDVAGSGKLVSGRTTVDLAVNAGPRAAVRVTGSAPLAANGALDLKVDGKLDAGLANALLSAGGRNASGAVTVAMQLRGTLTKPDARGTLTLANGGFRDDETGFKLTGLSALVTANGDTIRVDRFSGTTPNGGTIGASGEVRLDPAGGFPGTLRVVGNRAQLVSNDVVAATADLALDIGGRLAERPEVSGRITILSMDITVPGSLGGLAAPIPGTKHLNPTATARARLAALARAKANARGPVFDATLALTVSAANRVFVRGRGLNAEFGGDLHVAGSALNPAVTGGFDLLRGTLALVGQPLTFTRGRVSFHGGVIPDLDLVAETNAADITARINVTGPANQPAFAITSSPSLPEDEILARILFQKPSGNLSAFQALELANAVGTLSGRADVLDPLRKSLGLSNLGLGPGSSGSGLLGLGRTINDRISVDISTGVQPQDNGVNVNLDVTRHIRLQAGVDASGGTDVGVGAEWEFK